MNEVQRFNDFTNIAPPLIKENSAMLKWLCDNGFFVSPASSKYHGNYAGGLYDHSKAVFKALTELTECLNLEWQRPESPFIVGMFHDLCKIDQYKEVVDEEGKTMFGEFEPRGREVHYERVETMLKGHGEKSVLLLSPLMQLTEEEMFCIRFHMGFSEKDDLNSYGNAVERFPNVLFAHTADMMASRIKGV